MRRAAAVLVVVALGALALMVRSSLGPGEPPVGDADPPPVAVPDTGRSPPPDDVPGSPPPDDGARPLGAAVGTPVGFAAGVTGGEGGDLYVVTSLEDSGPGTLRAGLETDGPRWIRFATSGTISLESSLVVPSDITIDGRGQTVSIAVARDVTGIQVHDVRNVIIHDLRFVGGGATRSGAGEPRSDAINVLRSQGVWIDHNTLTGWGDKLVGIPAASGVTVSYNHFHDQGECLLVGVQSLPVQASRTRVTVHHNLFEDCGSRTPRVGDGSRVHLFNNVVRGWQFYAVAAVRGAEIASERNVFTSGDNHRAVLVENGRGGPGLLRSTCDLVSADAHIQTNGDTEVFDPADGYDHGLHGVGPELVRYLDAWAGHQRSLGRRDLPEIDLTGSGCPAAPTGS